MPDPRFWVLREALSSYASDPDDPPVREDDFLEAAVAVVVRGGGDLELLLIKRARHEGDPWSGHMALPGGRREPGDPDLARTAIRETREETGVDLAADGHFLGRLEEVTPSSVKLPRLSISPFVFGVPPDTGARRTSPEVESVHWVSLPHLRHPDTRCTHVLELPDGVRSFPGLRVEGEIVWGLTYRILTDFFRVYPEGDLEAASSGDDASSGAG